MNRASSADVLSPVLAKKPVLNSAGSAVAGVLRDVLQDKSNGSIFSPLVMVLMHHPGLLVTDTIKAPHDNANVYPTDSVSQPYHGTGLSSSSEVWLKLKSNIPALLTALSSRDASVVRHARALLASLLVHGDSDTVVMVMRELVKILWTDVSNVSAVRNEHLQIWSDTTGEVVVVGAYVPKIVDDKHNIKGRKEDDAEWERMEEESRKAKGKPVVTKTTKKLTPKEEAHRRQLLSEQADVRANVQGIMDDITSHLSTLWQFYSHCVVLDPALLSYSTLFVPALRMLCCSNVPAVSKMSYVVMQSAYDAYRIGCRSTCESTYWNIIVYVL